MKLAYCPVATCDGQMELAALADKDGQKLVLFCDKCFFMEEVDGPIQRPEEL